MHVSVVIPVRNAADLLPACFAGIKAQDYPHDRIEVIVADGSSSDPTPMVAESFDFGGIRCRCLRLNETGRSQGLNAAIRAAKGDAICRLDVRTRIAPDYIRRCVTALSHTRASNVGGLQVPVCKESRQKAVGWAMANPFGVGNAQFRIASRSGYVDTVYLGFFRREIFEQVGYFDESADIISEDSDMNERIRENGGKIYLDVEIHAGYEPRKTLIDQFRLYFRYGGARAGNLLKHRKFSSCRQLAAPLFLVMFFGLPIAGLLVPAAHVAWVALVGLYALIDIAVSVAICTKRRDWKPFPFMPLVFPCMHFGWGLGFFTKLLWSRGNVSWKG